MSIPALSDLQSGMTLIFASSEGEAGRAMESRLPSETTAHPASLINNRRKEFSEVRTATAGMSVLEFGQPDRSLSSHSRELHTENPILTFPTY